MGTRDRASAVSARCAQISMLVLPTRISRRAEGDRRRPLALPPQTFIMRPLVLSLASLVAACSCRMISPRVVGSSHSLQGYEAERVADGNEKTYWLVPGGQRMEAMS